MGSKLLRRSGTAVYKCSDVLGWKPDMVVQVGVGFSHQEVDVMKEVWPDVPIVGCEASPSIVKNLKDTYPGRLFGFAVGDRCGRTVLYEKPRHKDGSSLKLPHKIDEPKKFRKIEVDVFTLDWLSSKLDDCGSRILLWLDCEGSELSALRGGEKFIGNVGMVNVEITGNPPSGEWGSPYDIHRWLLDHGFLRQTLHTNRTTEGQYDAIYVKRNIFKPEYCCDPFWESQK